MVSCVARAGPVGLCLGVERAETDILGKVDLFYVKRKQKMSSVWHWNIADMFTLISLLWIETEGFSMSNGHTCKSVWNDWRCWDVSHVIYIKVEVQQQTEQNKQKENFAPKPVTRKNEQKYKAFPAQIRNTNFWIWPREAQWWKLLTLALCLQPWAENNKLCS